MQQVDGRGRQMRVKRGGRGKRGRKADATLGRHTLQQLKCHLLFPLLFRTQVLLLRGNRDVSFYWILLATSQQCRTHPRVQTVLTEVMQTFHIQIY